VNDKNYLSFLSSVKILKAGIWIPRIQPATVILPENNPSRSTNSLGYNCN